MRERRNYLVRDQLAEDVVGRAQRSRPEGNDGYRRAQVVCHVARFDHRPFAGLAEPECPDGLLDMLEITLAQVLDVGIQRWRELVAHIGGHDDLPRPR
jgi:hypothetical protein